VIYIGGIGFKRQGAKKLLDTMVENKNKLKNYLQ